MTRPPAPPCCVRIKFMIFKELAHVTCPDINCSQLARRHVPAPSDIVLAARGKCRVLDLYSDTPSVSGGPGPWDTAELRESDQDGDRDKLIDWRPSDTNIYLGLGFRVSCLHSHCYIWTMSFTLTLCPGWPGPQYTPPVLTCHYVG